MNKILIALDYGHSTQQVADKGYQLASALRADVLLLHVVADATYYSSLNYSPIIGFESFSNLDVMQTQAVEDVKKAAGEFLEKAKEGWGGLNIETRIAEGEVAEGILESAGEAGVEIIVMGSHGRSGIDKIIMGSVAESVLRRAHLPLYIVPVGNRK